MNDFIKFPKIHRLGKEETDGILELEVVVQEKIDGANVSIWIKDGELVTASRNRILPENDDNFKSFQKAVNENARILEFLSANPQLRLYGEWLVPHTIKYKETVYKKFYLFDILDTELVKTNDDGTFDCSLAFYAQSKVESVAEMLGVDYPTVFAEGLLSEEEIQEHVGKSVIGENGEGVVVKSPFFVNKWGNHCYAKIVTPEFLENNAITFGGNNKYSESYTEMYVVNKYVSLARVRKAMQKAEAQIDERLDKKHTPMVAGMVYYDLLTEEIWDIVKKSPRIDFKVLKSLVTKKAIQVFHDVLDDRVSVADGGDDDSL